MGLFDVFSGSAGRNAAIWQANLQQANEQTGENQIWNNLRQGLGIYGNAYGASQADLQNGTQQGRDDLARAYGLATGATNSGYDAAKAASAAGYGSASNYLSGGLANALASLYGGTGAAQGFLQGGAGQASGDISGGLGASLAALNQGYGGQQAVLGGLGSTFNPWSSPGASAQTMLANAQGLNGPQGNAAALSAFQASPGYQYQVQQALDQVNRAAAASGMANSGNTLTALQNRASDLANQGWQQWLAGLQGTGQTGLAATGQQAGIGSQLGSSLANQGLSTANVATGANQNLANIAQGTGNLMGNLAQQAGSQAGN